MLRGKSFKARVGAGAAMVLVAGTFLLPHPAPGESSANADRLPKGIDPALVARLDEAAAVYKQLASKDVAILVENCDKLVAALRANDLPAARQAWIDARVGYERSEIFTIKFPYLDAAIDAWPSGEVGFHAIEAKLFVPGSPVPLDEAVALADKVHTFQRVFESQPIYAHGVIFGIGVLAFELGESKAKGGESAISGTSLNDMQHNVEGIELAWNTVFAAVMQEKNKGVGGRVEKEIAEVKQMVSVASLDQVDAPALEAKAERLAGSVSDAAVALGWNPPDFSDTND